MNFLEFLYKILQLISFDIIMGFILFIFYKYIDEKYLSSFEISTLKEENKYLKLENQKVNGTSTKFWNPGDKI